MKTKILSTIFLLSTIWSDAYCQDTTFTFTKNGFTDYVVTSCEGKTQAELYKKAIDWISVTYKNPREVIKAQIENDYIRIEGASSSLICVSAMGKTCSDARYQIEISFKDNKYKFDVIKIEAYAEASQYSSGGWNEWPMNDVSLYYNKKGEIKGTYKYFPEYIPTCFNQLNKALKEFIMSDKIPSKKGDW